MSLLILVCALIYQLLLEGNLPRDVYLERFSVSENESLFHLAYLDFLPFGFAVLNLFVEFNVTS